VRMGVNHVTLAGAPYGELALESYHAILLMVPPQSSVFLWDTRSAIAAYQEDEKSFRDCMEALNARGHVAFFHSSGLNEFQQAKAVLREFDPAAPVLCLIRRQGNPLDTLWEAAWTLNRKPRQMQVITADAELAKQAAAERFVTHLLHGPAAQGRPDSSLLRHKDLAELREHLTRGQHSERQ